MKILSENLPRLHDYFELDITRILKHRLCFFINHHCLFSYKSLSFPVSPNVTARQSNPVYKKDISEIVRGFWKNNFLSEGANMDIAEAETETDMDIDKSNCNPA